ncbi:hypothetical protein GCM10022409_04100 [Hymenobacter glaciei]|uniref:Uncharacterized protein n=1 Tax=Hymenobacter glaciei TaxID=877209 RepID=A0ABP7TAN5_9BACT
MTSTPYPDDAAVGLDERWHAFFYSLCQVHEVPGLPAGLALPVLSTNGLWYDDAFATADASSQFTVFQLVDGRLTFSGDPRLFRGHAAIAAFRAQLEADWVQHEAQYLAATTAEQLLSSATMPALPAAETGLDAGYYFETFRSFRYVRAQFRRTGRFRSINAWLRGWKEEPGAFFLPASHPDFRAAHEEALVNQEYVLPGFDLPRLQPVGLAPASPYFTDGNSTLVYFDSAQQRLVQVNQYS